MNTSLTYFEIFQLLTQDIATISEKSIQQLCTQNWDVAKVLLSHSMEDYNIEAILYDLIKREPEFVHCLYEVPSSYIREHATFYCQAYSLHTKWPKSLEQRWTDIISANYGYNFRYESLSFMHISHPVFVKNIDHIDNKFLRNGLSDLRNHIHQKMDNNILTKLKPFLHSNAFKQYVQDAPQEWMLYVVNDPIQRSQLISQLTLEEALSSEFVHEMINSQQNAHLNKVIKAFDDHDQLRQMFYENWQNNIHHAILKPSATLAKILPFSTLPNDLRYAFWIQNASQIDLGMLIYPEYAEHFKQCFNAQFTEEPYRYETIFDPDFQLRKEQYDNMIQDHEFKDHTADCMSYQEFLILHHCGIIWPFGTYDTRQEINLHFSL